MSQKKMYITKLKMKHGCLDSQNYLDIAELYCDGEMATPPGFYPISGCWHHLLNTPWKGLQINISPHPYLIPAKTEEGEIYVRSSLVFDDHDLLFDLPREEAEA